jgi:hypothetical protein
MKSWNPEIIRATTPILLASVGALIGICVVLNPYIDSNKATAALGLAGTAIAGAAGLAQTGKNESDFSVQKHGEDLQVTTPSESSENS